MTSRKGDIIISVTQDNDEKSILIETADASIENTIGYEAEELVGMDLRTILIPSVNEIINTHLDFEMGGSDLGAVLNKVRDFGFITKLGYEIKLNMRISRSVSDNENPKFELILKDFSEISEGSKSALRNFRGKQVLDKETGLPDKASFMKEAEFINFCVGKGRLFASFALISIDGLNNVFKQYGKENTRKIIRELVSRCRINFRDDDIIGSIGDNLIGVILLDAQSAIAKNPLNRLRWQIASHPFDVGENEQATITLSIIYCEVNKDKSVEKAIEICQAELDELRKSGGNKIAEVV